MICEHFRAIGVHEASLDVSDLFNVSLQGDDSQDFGTRWDQALLSASKVPKANVLENLDKMRIRESLQLQTALAMYDQEIDRDRAIPTKLSKIEDYGKKTHRSNDQNAQLQSQKRKD